MEMNRREILRYLGYGRTEAGREVMDLVEDCITELEQAAACHHVYRVFPLTVGPGNRIDGGCFQTDSRNLAKNLQDCSQILVFGATIGAQVDMLLKRYTKLQMSKAVVMQAASAAMIEAYCNELNDGWKKQFSGEGWYLRPRFSPGYGDFELKNQLSIIGGLEAGKRAGITLTDSLIMAPTKSVTAVIGMSRKPGDCTVEGCEACQKKDCIYRRDS